MKYYVTEYFECKNQSDSNILHELKTMNEMNESHYYIELVKKNKTSSSNNSNHYVSEIKVHFLINYYN